MCSVIDNPENRYSKSCDCMILKLFDVFYHVTKSDLSYNKYRMSWNTVHDHISEHREIV